jgi:hypothetical protein
MDSTRQASQRGRGAALRRHGRPPRRTREGDDAAAAEEARPLRSFAPATALDPTGADPDFHRRDLCEAIESGAFPEWELPRLSAWAGGRSRGAAVRPYNLWTQLTFSDEDGHRFQVLLTNQQGSRIARLEQVHRRRAAIEDAIRCAKASGLRNLPFRAFPMNDAWLELVLTGIDLLAWTRRLLLSGTPLAACEPKRLRYRLLHVAGRIVRHARSVRLRLPRSWPWAPALEAAFTRLQALPSG